VVRERHAQPDVDLGFVGRVGVFDRLHDDPYLGHEGGDFLLGHAPTVFCGLGEPCFGEGAPTQGTWRYNLGDRVNHAIQYGRSTGMTNHMDVLRHAAGICRDAYEPETVERGLLERFAESGDDQRAASGES